MSAPSDVFVMAPEPADPEVRQARTRPGRVRDPESQWPLQPRRRLSYGVAVGLLLVVTAGFALLARLHPTLTGAHPATLSQLLAAATSALSGAFFILCVMRRRFSEEAAVLLMGTAVLVFGVFCVGAAELALPLAGFRAGTAPYVKSTYFAGLLATLVLLGLAALRLPRNSAARPGWSVIAALGLTGAAAGTGGLRAVQTALPRIPVPEQSALTQGAPVAAALILAAVWLALGTWYAVRGPVDRRPLLRWSGLMLFALAVSCMCLVLADGPAHIWIVGSGSLRLLALMFAVFGGAVELEGAFIEQRAHLLDLEVASRTNETRWQLERALTQDRHHDLRSALVAIEGAALTLERHYDTLSDQERDRLTAMLSSGVDRLQRLVVEDNHPRASFPLAEVVTPFVHNLVAEGESVDVDVPDHIVAYGSAAETAEVVRQLLDSARRRAPGSTITVRGEQDGQAVVLRVDDQVQGAPNRQPAAPVGRSAAAPTAPAGELPATLHVASRLMRGQGGDLWVEAERSGRYSFALSLPAPVLRDSRS